jgi:hypothetical protein
VLVEIEDEKLKQTFTQSLSFLTVLVGFIATTGIARLVYDQQLHGEDADCGWLDVLKLGFKIWPEYFFTMFQVGIRILLYTIMLIVPGVYMGVKYYFVDNLVIADLSKSDKVIEWSKDMVTDKLVAHFWTCFDFDFCTIFA